MATVGDYNVYGASVNDDSAYEKICMFNSTITGGVKETEVIAFPEKLIRYVKIARSNGNTGSMQIADVKIYSKNNLIYLIFRHV